jgi:hypothetical protein
LEYYADGEFPFEIIRCTIVQPRGEDPDHVRWVDYTLTELYDWLMGEVKPAYDQSLLPNAPANPTEDGCRWCKARGTCPELTNKALAEVSQINQPITAEPRMADISVLRDDQVKAILDAAPLFELQIKAAREYAIQQIEAGKGFPGYGLKPAQGNTTWIKKSDPDEVMKLLKNRKVPIDTYAPRKLASPTQVLKAIDDPKRKESIKKLTFRPDLPPKLVPIDDGETSTTAPPRTFGIQGLDPESASEETTQETPTAAISCLQ